MKPLPPRVEQLLGANDASPRLKAHLTLVHDAAQSLTEGIRAAWPDVAFNKEAVLFGAATHDIGKVIHPEELHNPGHAHEEAGVQLLLQSGFAEHKEEVMPACNATRSLPPVPFAFATVRHDDSESF